MIYAIRDRGAAGQVLVEMKSQKELDHRNATEERVRYRPVTRDYAHRWVKDDCIHETGLWVDDGRIRYAKADPEGH